MTNLEKSELVIARILQHLLEMGIQDGWILSFDDLKLGEDEGPFFGGAIKWLVAEGIIREEGIQDHINGDSRVLSPSLTSRGFAILGHKFSIDGKEVSATQVVQAKSKGSPSYTGIGDFLGGVLGGFTKSIGS